MIFPHKPENANYTYDHIVNITKEPPTYGFIIRWRPWNRTPGHQAWIVICINPFKFYLFGLRIF